MYHKGPSQKRIETIWIVCGFNEKVFGILTWNNQIRFLWRRQERTERRVIRHIRLNFIGRFQCLSPNSLDTGLVFAVCFMRVGKWMSRDCLGVTSLFMDIIISMDQRVPTAMFQTNNVDGLFRYCSKELTLSSFRCSQEVFRAPFAMCCAVFSNFVLDDIIKLSYFLWDD